MDYAEEKEKLDRQLKADRETVLDWHRDELRQRTARHRQEWKEVEHLSPAAQHPLHERQQADLKSLEALKEKRMRSAETDYKVGLEDLDKRRQELGQSSTSTPNASNDTTADKRDKARAQMDRIQDLSSKDQTKGHEQPAQKPTAGERMTSLLSRSKTQENDQGL